MSTERRLSTSETLTLKGGFHPEWGRVGLGHLPRTGEILCLVLETEGDKSQCNRSGNAHCLPGLDQQRPEQAAPVSDHPGAGSPWGVSAPDLPLQHVAI